MRDALIHFLDRIKDYEHESGHTMHEDERESSDIVDIHLEAVPELKNYVFISNVSPSALEFKAALTLLRDLADIQNGAPLVTLEKEWKEIMDSTYDFLEKHEG